MEQAISMLGSLYFQKLRIAVIISDECGADMHCI
jgi:hypothetical protein